MPSRGNCFQFGKGGSLKHVIYKKNSVLVSLLSADKETGQNTAVFQNMPSVS